jgi:hypothetical protein
MRKPTRTMIQKALDSLFLASVSMVLHVAVLMLRVVKTRKVVAPDSLSADASYRAERE